MREDIKKLFEFLLCYMRDGEINDREDEVFAIGEKYGLDVDCDGYLVDKEETK